MYIRLKLSWNTCFLCQHPNSITPTLQIISNFLIARHVRAYVHKILQISAHCKCFNRNYNDYDCLPIL